MDTTEENLKILLNGGSADDSVDFCDFSLADQNELTGK